jgi:chitinase
MRAHRSSLLVLLVHVGCGTSEGATMPTTAVTTADASSASSEPPGSSSAGTAGTGGTPTTTGAATTGSTGGTLPETSSDSTAEPLTGTSSDTGDATTDPSGGEACVDDHRVVAYVANWQECPTPAQFANWSHAVVAFAVTYMWTPNGNICDPACQIGPVAGCNGKSLAELVADLHAADVKVILSFGGAGMGGLWEGTCGEMTKCWDACLDKKDQVVDALSKLVVDNDLDGIDIDYEYCLHDPAHVDFVGGLTAGLRTALDALPGGHKLLTHAPMDHTLDAGDPYFSLVDEHADALDFLMPQYYNGGMSPFEPAGLAAIEQNYRALVDGPFGGDASRLVFGHCIEPGCAPVSSQPAALEVTKTVEGWYPNDGGVFFWAHPYETDGAFSAPFRQHFDENFCGG